MLNGPSGIEFLLTTVCRVNNPNEKPNIGLWYRPPANLSALDILYSTLESLDVSFLSSFVLLGDFNIDFYNRTPMHCFRNLITSRMIFYYRRLLNNPLARILTPITHLLLTWSYCQLLLES